jgi:RimJ/RimL family protein N-acetyltransferase
MRELTIRTQRLELIAATLELADAEMHDRSRFSALLDARVADWPPPLNDELSMQLGRDYLADHPDSVGWGPWYFILLGERRSDRIAIGNGGFKGNPWPDGTAEVGYSILEAYQHQGYGREAVRALVSWAFGHAEVRRVIAETLPDRAASIRLLQKLGFRLVGAGSEPGALRYELTREDLSRTCG